MANNYHRIRQEVPPGGPNACKTQNASPLVMLLRHHIDRIGTTPGLLTGKAGMPYDVWRQLEEGRTAAPERDNLVALTRALNLTPLQEAEVMATAEAARRKIAVGEVPNVIGVMVKKRRRTLGLTQQQLALRAGVSEGSVRRLESGWSRKHNLNIMEDILKALGFDSAKTEEFMASLRRADS